VFAFLQAGQTLAADRREAEARAAFQEAASWGDRLLKNQHAPYPPRWPRPTRSTPSVTTGTPAAIAPRRAPGWNAAGRLGACGPKRLPALEARRQRAEAKLRAVEP
jgi:hypothetical protein